jgi:hypothetical protein
MAREKPPARTSWIALTVVAAVVILFIFAYLNGLPRVG